MYLVIKNGGNSTDFRDAAGKYLGPLGRILAPVGSMSVFFGVTIIYSILASTNLLNFIKGIILSVNSSFSDAWYLNKYSVSIYIALAILPLLNLKHLEFIIKINSIGIVWVLYIIFFIITTSIMDYDPNAHREVFFRSKFVYLAGIMALSFFVHNFILTVARKANPKTVLRDVSIGFACGGLSYAAIGIVGYVAFGDIIGNYQNFLDVTNPTQPFGLSAKFAVVLQIFTLFPMISGVLRSQVFSTLLGKEYPGVLWTLVYSVFIVTVGALFGMFYPNVADVIRIIGAICGFIYIFFLPIAVNVIKQRKERNPGFLFYAFHALLLVVGVIIIILQFI